MDFLDLEGSDNHEAPVPALNHSSAEATEAPEPALMDPTTYGAVGTGRAPEDEELQSKLVIFFFWLGLWWTFSVVFVV